LSIPLETKNEFNHYQQIRSNNNLVNFNLSSINRDSPSLNICLIQSINIDLQHSTTNTIIPFTSSWKQIIVTNEDNSTLLNIIQITFTIPYQISNESIINKTIFITDAIHNQLLASLTNFCYNDSSFFLNYSTIQPLPQNICLYLLLNLTSSMILREIIFCRTIEDSYNITSLSDNSTATIQTVGPSGYFILSQCIIILIMMFIIYGVQTARQKDFIHRASERLIHSRPYISIFGNKTIVRTNSTAVNPSLHPAMTLQAGLNQIMFNRRLTSVTAPIEEQVLAANDLTTTIYDRRATRPSINRDLIDVKEFTKRMSIANESSIDTELNPI